MPSKTWREHAGASWIDKHLTRYDDRSPGEFRTSLVTRIQRTKMGGIGPEGVIYGHQHSVRYRLEGSHPCGNDSGHGGIILSPFCTRRLL